jgi:hypothetical protein
MLRLTQPFVALFGEALAVAFLLSMLLGLFFFQRWARLTFVLLGAVAVLSLPFRVSRYSLSPPPSFYPPIVAVMLLVTGDMIAMAFLPPVRNEFATQTDPLGSAGAD